MIDKKNINDIIHISFAGAANYGCYYIGIIKALNEIYPDLYKTVKISGTSVGSIHGINYLLNINNDILLNEYYNHSNNKYLLERLYLGDFLNNYYNKYG